MSSKETVVVELSRTDRSLLNKIAKAYENPVARFYSDPVNVAKTITEPQVTYPYLSGDVSHLAPNVTMSLDGQVINYKGVNYYAPDPKTPQDGE